MDGTYRQERKADIDSKKTNKCSLQWLLWRSGTGALREGIKEGDAEKWILALDLKDE